MTSQEHELKKIEPEESAPEVETALAHGGSKAATEIARLTAELGRVAAALERGEPEVEAIDREILERRLELALYEVDNTGALVPERFGKDLARAIEMRDLEMRKGKVMGGRADAEQAFLFVAMGELDRVNAEGGHAAGDRALQETVRVIEAAVQKHLRAELAREGVPEAEMAEKLLGRHDIYRKGGNEFAVSISGISAETRTAIATEIAANRPEVIPGKDPVPLAAVEMSFAEVIGLANRVQKELADRDRELQMISEEDMPRELIGILQAAATADLEVRKFLARAERLTEKVQRGDADTEEFYRRYLAKGFAGTAFERLDEIQKALQEDPESVRRLAREEAERLLGEQLGRERAESNLQRQVILTKSAERWMRGGLPELETIRRAPAALPEYPIAEGAGVRALREKREATELAPAGKERELAALEEMIERAKRDGLTGLRSRREYYREQQERVRAGREGGAIFIDMAFLKYFDREGGAETGNLAIKKVGEILEQAVLIAGVAGASFRYGGDEFTVQFEGGEAEGKKILDAIERLRAEAPPLPASSRATERYRPEMLQFNYGLALDSDADAVLAKLVEAGRYRREDFAAEPSLEAKVRAEIVTLLADAGVEWQKATNRILFLAERMGSEAYARDPAERKTVDTLVQYSEKAIFGSRGKEFLALASSRARELRVLREQVEELEAGGKMKAMEKQKKALAELTRAHENEVRAFVGRELELKREIDGQKSELVDEKIEDFVRERRLEERIGTLLAELQELRQSDGRKDERIRILEEELAALKRVRAELSK
ncbi:MAG: diguanylate cyclase [Patescibacteria group bacterium]